MEANTKQQQLTFDKGITNVPSDAVCSDNALDECVGMVYENGEHRVIQKPREVMDFKVGSRLLYVHKFNDAERYICYKSSSNAVVFVIDKGLFTLEADIVTGVSLDGLNITSVGKVLVISTGNSIKYALWKNDKYDVYDRIPEPKVTFGLGVASARVGSYMSHEGSLIFDKNSGVLNIDDGEDAEEGYNNLVLGLYAENKKKAAHNGRFINPFMARYALELYDGSYMYVSNPVMIFPSVSRNSFLVHNSMIDSKKVAMVSCSNVLSCMSIVDYTDWSDIVKKIAIFVSDDVDIYDITEDPQRPVRYSIKSSGGFINTFDEYLYDCIENTLANTGNNYNQHDTSSFVYCYNVLRSKETSVVKEELENLSVFYRIGEIGITGGSYWNSSNLRPYILENLTTQEQLPEDDYFSHCQITGSVVNSYNGRLNIANIKRGFFEGFDQFMPFDNPSSALNTYDFYVTIKTDAKDVIIKHTVSTKEYQGIYFYYPDPRASHVVIMKGSTCVCDEDLTEHPSLHGAYYFRVLPNEVNKEWDHYTPKLPIHEDNGALETLPNYIVSSEVNNPFLFKAEGYVAVGNGSIIGITTITQALSQGQFGQYPIIVFSEEGIWAVSISGTGTLAAVHPMSREVCNNANSITQTDGAVFFTSKKGLMLIAGSTVKCVSEQMSGKEGAFAVSQYPATNLGGFDDFLANCFIAYDYRDSLLWIFNDGAPTCYVYSIKSGTFAKFSQFAIRNVVNNYPDYLLQDMYGKVYSLMGRYDINDDDAEYFANILTRPMKLENSLVLKSIRQVRHITDMEGTMKLRIFASNNLRQWAELTSLRGTPWKYFRFRYDFSGLKATDRFAGSIIVTQERRTDKLR